MLAPATLQQGCLESRGSMGLHQNSTCQGSKQPEHKTRSNLGHRISPQKNTHGTTPVLPVVLPAQWTSAHEKNEAFYDKFRSVNLVNPISKSATICDFSLHKTGIYVPSQTSILHHFGDDFKKKKKQFTPPTLVLQYPPTNPSLGPSLVLDLLIFGGARREFLILLGTVTNWGYCRSFQGDFFLDS